MKNVLYEIFCYFHFSSRVRCRVVLCFFLKKSFYPSHKTLKSEKKSIKKVCVYITYLCVYIYHQKKDEKSIHSEREKLSFFLYTFLLQRASKASFSHYYLNSFFIIIKYVWSFSHTNMRTPKKERERAKAS